jgi:hypothetical protein
MATCEEDTQPAVQPGGIADLEKLAAEIDGQTYVVALVTTQGRPHLHITNRQATQLTERIYSDGKAYWWGWAERIADVADLATAAAAVSRVRRSIGDRARG